MVVLCVSALREQPNEEGKMIENYKKCGIWKKISCPKRTRNNFLPGTHLLLIYNFQTGIANRSILVKKYCFKA